MSAAHYNIYLHDNTDENNPRKVLLAKIQDGFLASNVAYYLENNTSLITEAITRYFPEKLDDYYKDHSKFEIAVKFMGSQEKLYTAKTIHGDIKPSTDDFLPRLMSFAKAPVCLTEGLIITDGKGNVVYRQEGKQEHGT